MAVTWEIPSISREWVGPITVTVDGAPVTTFQVAVKPKRVKPVEADWTAPLELEAELGVLVGDGTAVPLTERAYELWARFTADPERPAIKVGDIRVV